MDGFCQKSTSEPELGLHSKRLLGFPVKKVERRSFNTQDPVGAFQSLSSRLPLPISPSQHLPVVASKRLSTGGVLLSLTS